MNREASTWLVAGLGNPGPRYESTRHNIGFRVVDALGRAANATPYRDKFHGELATGTLDAAQLLLLKPQTFMNDSGRSVQAASTFYKVKPAELIVIHDELDVPFGELRLKQGGGDAGHNGLRSITGALGGNYVRLRVGIGRPPPDFRGSGADFVLQAFAPTEQEALPEVISRAVEAVTLVTSQGLERAMNRTNQRPRR